MKKTLFWGTIALMAAWAQAQPYSAWNRFRTLTVNTTSAAAGANVAGNVTNFPLLVRLSNVSAATGANVLTEALAAGADLRFTDSSGMNALSYQIETWSATSAAIWVKVPVVTGNASTQIRMYWGRASQTSASSAQAVFDTTNGYTGVWHLNESGATTVKDATVNGLVFTGDANVVSVPGVAGDARYYNQGQAGGDAYYLDEAVASPKFVAAGANSRITISAWVNRRGAGTSGSQGVFSNFRYSAGNNRSYALMRDVSGNFNVLTSVDGAADSRRVSTSATFADNAWHHVVATINPAGGAAPVIRIWVNGVAQTTSGTNSSAAAAAVFAATGADAKPLIGALERAYQQGTESFIDELQLANGTIRDSNWIRLSYQTQRPDSARVVLGATQSVTARGLFYPLKNAVYMINTPIVANEPVTSGAATAWGITPAASSLPAGLSFNTSNGFISGTPTASFSSTQFIVNATVGGNTVYDTLTIAVTTGNPPNPPTGVAATRGNKQATVTWIAPLVVGSSAITGYKVYASWAAAPTDTSKSCTTTGALTCVVTGLTNGTSYTFTAKATNSSGISTASTASAAVTPAGLPGPPLNPVIAFASGAGATGTATLNWVAPASDSGSPIIEYYASSTPAGAFCYVAMPAPLNCTVTGLVYGTPYTIWVYAVNSVGIGANSASVTITATGIRPGSMLIRVSGSARPFTFVLPGEALTSTDKVTMLITDIYGRTVWSKSVNPKQQQAKEITWNGKASNGRSVSAGMYIVKIKTVAGGKSTEFTQKAITVKPL